MTDKQTKEIVAAIQQAGETIAAAIRGSAGTNPAIPKPQVHPPTGHQPDGGQQKALPTG
jgi:hypothetical protein